MKLQFDIKRINILKDIILQLRRERSTRFIQQDMETQFKDVAIDDLLVTILELLYTDDEITMKDVLKLFDIYSPLSSHTIDEQTRIVEKYHPGHPIRVLKEENMAFQSTINRMNYILQTCEKDELPLKDTDIAELKHLIFQLGQFHKHYHRKEKIIFAIMERYGYYDPIRYMWRADDHIRAMYQGAKKQINQLPNVNFKHLRITYDKFEKAFTKMIFQEEMLLLPVLILTFSEADWITIAKESSAFGYAMIEPEEEWLATLQNDDVRELEANNHKKDYSEIDKRLTSANLPFGSGYLTVEEANLILNNLPLEITYIDKNMIFKYFNNITEASEMMLVRTPSSIGRNAANCHPPKSLNKVMTLIRDLKTKKRTQETMWFKKRDNYVHITYKPIFNEEDEFLGILEYVQDIQPFFNLPTEVKRNLQDHND